MDVRDPDDNRLLVAAAVDRWGRLDSVVPNAGVGMYGGILDHPDEEIRRMIDTNYDGTVWAVRAAVPAMLETGGGGDVVIVSSVAGLRGGADEAVYAGTKFAQVGLAGSLDRELREQGIRVTAIAPAGVETEFALGYGRTAGDPGLADYLRPEDVAFAIRTVLQQPRRCAPRCGRCGPWGSRAEASLRSDRSGAARPPTVARASAGPVPPGRRRTRCR